MSLKASWVSRLVSNQLVNWKVIPCKYFAKLGKKMVGILRQSIYKNIIQMHKYLQNWSPYIYWGKDVVLPFHVFHISRFEIRDTPKYASMECSSK
jgi:hypothetical protein